MNCMALVGDQSSSFLTTMTGLNSSGQLGLVGIVNWSSYTNRET